jgi:hypothetical protein
MKVSNVNPIQQNSNLQVPASVESKPQQAVMPPPTQTALEAPANAISALQAESVDPAYTAPPENEVVTMSPQGLDSVGQEMFQDLQSPEQPIPVLTEPDLPAEPSTPFAFSFNSEQLEVQSADKEDVAVQSTPVANVQDLDTDAQDMVQTLQRGIPL